METKVEQPNEDKQLRLKEKEEFIADIKKSGFARRLDGMWQKDGKVYSVDDNTHNILEVKGVAVIPEDELPKTQTALTTYEETPDEKEYTELTRLDEAQVAIELSGKIVDNFFYEIERYDARKKQMKKTQILSLAGIKTIAQKMGCISVTPNDVIINETTENYRCLVAVKDIKKNIQMVGVAEQSKRMDKGGQSVPDPFALQKAYSKAVRNAIRWLLPEYTIQQALQEWLKTPKQ